MYIVFRNVVSRTSSSDLRVESDSERYTRTRLMNRRNPELREETSLGMSETPTVHRPLPEVYVS